MPSQSKKMKTSRAIEMIWHSESQRFHLTLNLVDKKFWSKCQECFVFEVDTKYIISINQMHRALMDWTNWSYKKKGMLDSKHYLVNMLDPSIK
jgi:hypothetical protein